MVHTGFHQGGLDLHVGGEGDSEPVRKQAFFAFLLPTLGQLCTGQGLGGGMVITATESPRCGVGVCVKPAGFTCVPCSLP